ncbi:MULTISPECIES: class I adenylate-forming enzyme family protein [Geobacillus]|uniref:Long-chain-fatty-acid--CoA ligase n=1 Tax=Geobacillus proteiniphilus TaxID=860353 RepID=A0A1Q5T450_9BACL|nr:MULTISPECIES: long-chain fatty acid--CoA ligase [Geobacillus]MED0654314.1 long-chain fatty acid--CoA ligase [Anoxybacillus geothermalis]KZM55777.1 long-chain fatty acid--CoA ligase [Geobacillus stearothermophilus]MBW7641567.1 long-chain fatty acid--CoA ligase [Geobacillus thermoleovorans]MDF9296184.1 long-chain fatty acid--CoA ligase [Geobacillus stearothermophilus]OKO95019.1 Long-chain-fatty-acid--CoA ligase [Geobacillus proteiniphilus]
MRLTDIWKRNIEEYGPYPLLVFEGKEYTNIECDTRSSQLAHALIELGVKPGDRVVVTMPNSPEVIIAFSGVLKAGAVVVPVLPLLQTQELHYIFKDCQPKVVLTAEMLWAKAKEAANGLPAPPMIVTLDAPDSPHSLRTRMEQAPASLTTSEVNENDPAALLYTSGTTGQPKGVVLTHRNLSTNAEAAAEMAKRLPTEFARVGLGVLPISHAFGFTMMNVALLLGDQVVLLPYFEPKKALEAIERHRVTHTAMVPAMFHALCHYAEADRYDTSSLVACISGSAALPPELAEQFQRKFNCLILEGYGLSEAAPIVTATDPTKPIKLGSVGLPLPGVRVAVVDEYGNPLPPNEVGELIVSGPNVFQGYYGKDEETRQALRDGWLYTGDMARIDEDGYVFIVDRKKDVIIRGGFNIYPRDIEELLMSHPDVLEAGVVGVPSPKMGEEVAAYVVVRRGAQVTEAELVEFCQKRLAKYKTPRFLKKVGYLPKTMIGKIDKKKLREWASEFIPAVQS